MKNYNIGIVTTWFERGAAYVSKQYLNSLQKNANVFVYARGGEEQATGLPEWDKQYVEWDCHENSKHYNEFNIDQFKQWLITNKIDAVIFNEERWWTPVKLCNEMGIKTIAYIDYYTSEILNLFQSYDLLICNTKRHSSVFEWHPQVAYIPWGTDIELYKPKSFEPVGEKLTFFHSYGYSPQRKGTDFIIKAFSMLENCKLIIHGQKPLIEFYPELIDLQKKLEKEGKLVYIEKTCTAPGLYYMGDIYLYPSRLDGIGLTIAEALSSGLPVITSDNAPMNEFVNKKSGLTVSINKLSKRSDNYFWPTCEVDIEDLAQKMQFYIDNYKNISFYKSNAREYALENLNWEENSKNLFDIIKNANILDKTLKDFSNEQIVIYENNRYKKLYNKKILFEFILRHPLCFLIKRQRKRLKTIINMINKIKSNEII